MNLSQQQQEIIDYNDDEDILVIACPGSGKTHTLIHKYIKIINNNIYKPEEIIIITFTKKAGNELINRLNNLISNNKPYYIGTIHGLAYKVLKQYTNFNYTILNEYEYTNYIYNLLNEYYTQNNKNIEYNIKNNIISIIDQISCIYPINLKYILKKNKLDKYYEDINNIYKLYQKKKKYEKIIDYNDLMIKLSKFLNSNKSIELKNNIKYIFFDEYQDINPIQNYILNKFNDKSKLMLVGDDCQSIYSFRGSNIDYILNYNKKIFLLETNYRSNSHIVNLYQNIISQNKNQINKNIISIKNSDNKPYIYYFDNYINIYSWLSNKLKNKVNNKNVIIARTNLILDNLEYYLIKNLIPYNKHLGNMLLNKEHIIIFISFIIISYNIKSSIHWRKVLCYNNKYTIDEANKIINSSNNIIQTLSNIDECKSLIKLLNDIKKKNNFDKLNIILNYFKENFNLSNNEIIDIENIIQYFKSDNNLNDYINNIYLNYENNNINSIYLTTIHGSKGLEWDNVYFINNNVIKKDINKEEEIRLLYVATSRAKNKLTILCLKNNLLSNINENLYNLKKK